ncbi:hypothetical protein P879_08749 [Paragonimus westermani]|uniref:C3H1-type domain-containing protein n=1 Tax=Paragonimus westermani TaxID=34504 RepID=A0A8T0DIB2_9TREM|nr:hypothetical protein P879_08749 [Paragonimus westermani]
MPPKKQDASKKAVEKQKQKVIEDKTFGLKNKKGGKQQKFIQHVQLQVTQGNKTAKELERLEREKQERKEEKKREKAELNELFKPVAELQKCAKGVDPKSVLCVFFKQGQCAKGDKCKFSHDLSIERKGEKRGIYVEENNTDGRMDDWDIEKLEEVVSKKHDDTNKGLPPSTIICKYFLEAVESLKYGWFWECPNGKSCHYRHALPPGFVLKRDQKKMEEQKESISLDDLIEKERQALGLNQTKVTFKTFLDWKKRKRAEKLALGHSAKLKREADFKQGRMAGISGREVFEFNPNLVMESVDDDAGDGGVVCSVAREEGDDEQYTGPMRDIDINTFLLVEDEENGETMQDTAVAEAYAVAGTSNGLNELDGIDVDEQLFDQCDLEGLEDEIEELELEA